MRHGLILALFALCVYAEVFKVYTEQNPPYNFMENGTVTGRSTKLLKALFQQCSHQIEGERIWFLPWVQAYHEALHVNNSVIYSTVRTPEREMLFQWVGPIGKMTLGIVAKKRTHIRIASSEQLQRYKIATIPDTASEKLLINLGVDEAVLERFGQVSSQIKKLAQNRVDAIAYSVDGTFSILEEMGYDPNDYEVVYLLKESDLYFAFNKETHPQTITALNATLKTLLK
ncbi:substrate-binding periplasmic protein [Sulfurospirillum multivorans]|uniref:Extracellular solute-binding protein n=2 Tax=Sulfurospirillum multivorans TaxID=66821 RepID=A0AA86APM9_SULMK|nr:transporter substrate-binding domain-containing protein [Sulfurospirillum multivorans]AHJ13333.1 putative extracellular solute-binding protein [Sulfurospirillum multivorans DSM 12446]QEH06824.1 putative extracellular solute-binding protein [Sulfurospirillum multivorans]